MPCSRLRSVAGERSALTTRSCWRSPAAVRSDARPYPITSRFSMSSGATPKALASLASRSGRGDLPPD